VSDAVAVSATAPLQPARSLRFDPAGLLWMLPAVAVAAGAAWLHRHALSAPLWIDEGLSIGVASHPLTEIPRVLRVDGSPPLYYLLLHIWIKAFGTSPTATHELSLLFAALAVPAAAWVAWSNFGRRAAIACALLVALSPFLFLYGDETRMYSLLFLEATLATGAFLQAFVMRRRGYAPVLAVLLAALLYTHGWGLFFGLAAGLAALALLVAGPDRKRMAIDLAIAFGGAAVLFAPWVPTLLFQAAHTGAPWSHEPNGRSLQRGLGRMLGGRIPETLLLVVAGGGALAAAWMGRARDRRALLCTVALAAGTLLIAWGFSNLHSPAWALRYLVIVAAPLLLAIGVGLARAGWAGAIALALVGATMWFGLPHPGTLNRKSNVDLLARHVNARLPAGTLVASPQPEQVPVLRYYLPAGMRWVTPLGVPTDSRVMDWTDALARLKASRIRTSLEPALRRLRPHQRLLLVRPLFGRADSPWTRTIQRQEHAWNRFVRRDRSFVIIASLKPSHYSSRATVGGLLVSRRPSPPVGHHGASRRHRA